MHTRINTYVGIQERIPSHQVEFREKHGTIEQAYRITSEIRNAFDESLMYKNKTILPSYPYNRKFVGRWNTASWSSL